MTTITYKIQLPVQVYDKYNEKNIYDREKQFVSINYTRIVSYIQVFIH